MAAWLTFSQFCFAPHIGPTPYRVAYFGKKDRHDPIPDYPKNYNQRKAHFQQTILCVSGPSLFCTTLFDISLNILFCSHPSYNRNLVSECGLEPQTPRPKRGMLPLHHSEMVSVLDLETRPRVPETRMQPLHYTLLKLFKCSSTALLRATSPRQSNHDSPHFGHDNTG